MIIEFSKTTKVYMYIESIRQTLNSLTSSPSYSDENPDNEPNVLETPARKAMFSVKGESADVIDWI
jgi:hypothetical protein